MRRNYNLEIIRMISCIFVIVIHVTNYFCRAYGEITQSEYLFALLLDTLARVSVPCFFMISGALLLGREEPLKKHGERLLRFLIALVVWSVVYYIWNRAFMKTEYDLKEILYVPTEPHLWYLYAMIPIYMVLPFFQVMCKGMSRKLERTLLVVCGASVVFNYMVSLQNGEAYYDLPLIGDKVYMLYIFIGYFIYKYRRYIRISQKWAAAIFIGCMTGVFALTVFITQRSGEHYERVLEYGCPLIVLAGAAFFMILIRWQDCEIRLKERTRRLLDIGCGCSFGIYLIHILFLDGYKKYAEPAAVSAWIAVPVLIAGIGGLSFLCITLLRRSRIGRAIT